MLLHDGGRAPNARRVRIYLAEKGLSVPLRAVDLAAREHRGPAFTTLNPLQRVPALELDDGEVITESVAICLYLEALHPEPPLFGADAVEKARVEMWQRRLELELYQHLSGAFRHLSPGMAALEDQVPAWGESCKPRALSFMRLLDRHLVDKEFVCGSRFTIADITGLVALDFTRAARLAIPEELTHVRRWHQALGSRPSAAA